MTPPRIIVRQHSLNPPPIDAKVRIEVGGRRGFVPQHEHGSSTTFAGTGRWVAVDVLRATDLGETPVTHDRHLIGDRQRLVLVVGHQ